MAKGCTQQMCDATLCRDLAAIVERGEGMGEGGRECREQLVAL